MNIKNIETEIINGLKKIEKTKKILQKKITAKEVNEEKLFRYILKVLKQYPGNIEFIKIFLLYYQLSKTEEIINSYSFEEMSSLFENLSLQFKNDVELQLEYYYFLNNVMDREKDAKKNLKLLKTRLTKEIERAVRF